MSKIPKYGATPLQFVIEEALPRNPGWRPIGWTWDQRAALAELDAQCTSYARRVVQVVAVRLPAGPPTAAELRELAAAQNPRGRGLGDPTETERVEFARHVRELGLEAEYAPDRYAGEDLEPAQPSDALGECYTCGRIYHLETGCPSGCAEQMGPVDWQGPPLPPDFPRPRGVTP